MIRTRRRLGRVLLLGASSYVGRELFAALGPQRAIATYRSRPIPGGVYFDSLWMSVGDLLTDTPDVSHAVILLGDTDPESCAADRVVSHALNVESITRVIDELVVRRIKPIFISSEFVFDGCKGNYVESDPVNPILTYGRQKVTVEQYLQRVADAYAIVRLAKVFGSQPGDGTLFTAWLDAIERGGVIRCARDQIFSPIHVADVAAALIGLLEHDCCGVFHLAGHEAYRRLDLLETLLAKLPEGAGGVEVVACSIHDFDLRERRPEDVSMVPDKLVAATGVHIRQVARLCEEIVAAAQWEGDVARGGAAAGGWGASCTGP